MEHVVLQPGQSINFETRSPFSSSRNYSFEFSRVKPVSFVSGKKSVHPRDKKRRKRVIVLNKVESASVKPVGVDTNLILRSQGII